MTQEALEPNYKAEIIRIPVEYQEEIVQAAPETHKTKKASAMECLYNDEEIIAVCNVFKKYLDEAKTFAQEKAARRNLTMYICAIEIGLRGGDFCSLKWNDIYNPDWTFNHSAEFIPQKTRKAAKKVNLIWGTNFEVAISEWLIWKNTYIKQQKLDDYIFTAQKPHKDKTTGEKRIYVDPKAWYKIVENARKEAGIRHKIGTHGLRKTMVHQYIMLSDDKSLAMEEMSTYLGHSQTRTTRVYGCFQRENVRKTKQRMVCLTEGLYDKMEEGHKG